jgi:hypothetical protein
MGRPAFYLGIMRRVRESLDATDRALSEKCGSFDSSLRDSLRMTE